MIGEIEGIEPGTMFKGRKELHDAGVHCGHMRGIADRGGESIVLSGGYRDDKDDGDVIIYTGEGGRDSTTGLQIADQTLTLVNHFREGNPIRVTRGHQAGPPHAPRTDYRYDGLYRIEDCWQETGTDGFLIWRYRLVKISSSDEISVSSTPVAPEGNANPSRSKLYTTRVIRNSAVGNLHNYTCQISGVKLSTLLAHMQKHVIFDLLVGPTTVPTVSTTFSAYPPTCMFYLTWAQSQSPTIYIYWG